MLCDELKAEQWLDYSGEPMPCYPKAKVDETIAELKEFAENACLERDDNQTAIDELQSENRKLKRALWLARALRARDIQRWWIAVTCAKITERACRVWNNVERKCRAKADEY